MKLLLFAGAGTSIELGVPAMKGLAVEFLAHTEQWNIEPALVRDLMGEILDVENLIESLDQVCSARSTLEAHGEISMPLDRVDIMRSEVEWFVQHAAERIAAPDAHLMWGAVLRKAKDHNITFVTTNYDRAIELAANVERVSLTDGFEPFEEKEIAKWIGFSETSGNTSIVKLHGSTDWYADRGSGQPLKLRHPMPLFGRAALQLSPGIELGSALVLPSREKLLTKPPYPRLSQAFLNAVDECEAAIFVGSSLRDLHIQNAAADMANVRPVFMVNPSGKSIGLDGVYTIAQAASQFLISTLPTALFDSEPLAILKRASETPETKDSSVLGLVKMALSVQEDTERRCQAIENLDERSVTLDEHLISKLLSDENGTVARYALGLVYTSPARDHLLGLAVKSPHASDSAFAEELTLLKKMVDDKE